MNHVLNRLCLLILSAGDIHERFGPRHFGRYLDSHCLSEKMFCKISIPARARPILSLRLIMKYFLQYSPPSAE